MYFVFVYQLANKFALGTSEKHLSSDSHRNYVVYVSGVAVASCPKWLTWGGT